MKAPHKLRDKNKSPLNNYLPVLFLKKLGWCKNTIGYDSDKLEPNKLYKWNSLRVCMLYLSSGIWIDTEISFPATSLEHLTT